MKSKLSAKYNHLIIHIQLVKCQHFLVTINHLCSGKKKKKKRLVTWINLLPIIFTQQENTGVRRAALKTNYNSQNHSSVSLHASFKCLQRLQSEAVSMSGLDFVSYSTRSIHLLRYI